MDRSSKSSRRGRRRRQALWAVGIVLLAASTFVLVWFQPQKLFIDDHVDEAAPAVTSPPPSTTRTATIDSGPTTSGAAPAATDGVEALATGSFRSLEPKTPGQAFVLLLPGGE